MWFSVLGNVLSVWLKLLRCYQHTHTHTHTLCPCRECRAEKGAAAVFKVARQQRVLRGFIARVVVLHTLTHKHARVRRALSTGFRVCSVKIRKISKQLVRLVKGKSSLVVGPRGRKGKRGTSSG
uniref:Putative secreted protein n=1 Tax=Anopheles darlingi TaxID=43151 RepID=A0A2M4D820_ANODA